MATKRRLLTWLGVQIAIVAMVLVGCSGARQTEDETAQPTQQPPEPATTGGYLSCQDTFACLIAVHCDHNVQPHGDYSPAAKRDMARCLQGRPPTDPAVQLAIQATACSEAKCRWKYPGASAEFLEECATRECEIPFRTCINIDQ